MIREREIYRGEGEEEREEKEEEEEEEEGNPRKPWLITDLCKGLASWLAGWLAGWKGLRCFAFGLGPRWVVRCSDTSDNQLTASKTRTTAEHRPKARAAKCFAPLRSTLPWKPISAIRVAALAR
ncbi:hypothetical protein V1477_020247 [Vespula maculifrons]|uniref:Uncharacterized protein n=1 Tax=Vespula maculifrons TaxID=7453 RepID=A0ABD2ALD2_VESMC